MDPKIWSQLPTEIIQKIIGLADLPIDSRLAFKVRPGKIDEARAWRLWFMLYSHDGLIYNLETESLHIFRIPGFHIVRRPYKLNYTDKWATMFNEEGADHMIEITGPTGEHVVVPAEESFYTEMRVLLRGSGLARMINASGATF